MSQKSITPMQQLQVVIQPKNGGPRNEVLADFPVYVGRGASSTLRLESDMVSRQHIVVSLGQNGIIVEDVSTNGTLAGTRLLRKESAEVGFGIPIVVGDFTLTFFPLQGAPARMTRPAPRMTGAVPPAPLPTWESGQLPRIDTQDGGHAEETARVYQRDLLTQTSAQASHSASAAIVHLTSSQAAPVMNLTGATLAPPLEVAQKLPLRPQDEALRQENELRRSIHKMLLEYLDLATIDARKLDDPSMRPKVLAALQTIVAKVEDKIPKDMDKKVLIGELADEALGLGPLERFIADQSISEIMVVDPNTIYVEKGGKLVLSNARFTDDERVRAVIERIVTPLGRRIDESSPLVDARLKDGSRVNAIIRPIALRGSCITIRKFAKNPLTLEKLVGFGSMTTPMGTFLTRCVIAKRNIVISGGTGSGKTTLLNVLSGVIPEDERIVTIEDAAELQLKQPHVVSLETRPPNLEGRGEYTIRDLVKNALRMRPDRIVVGECRGGEALDMLQAMNTGHDGSLTTTHANSPEEALNRLETLVLMAGLDLPVRAIREQIASSVHVIVQQSRLSDGSRKVTHISEVTGLERDTGEINLRHIFQFVRTGTGPKGKVIGEYRATGYLPSFLNDFIVMGLVNRGEPYL
ncbi:MAG: ATPase, T2SS/T4P/T4SS family [Polyangiaceae bacterium]